MKKSVEISTLFIDIGGVLLTNGWDHNSRALAAKTFKLNAVEMESRHHLTFDTYEVGKITLEQYLQRVIFYEKRSFTQDEFKKFMFAQSKPFPLMIQLICQLKQKYGLKVAVVSNEGRELNEERIHKFKLSQFVDFFISSSFVHFRKPDEDIFRVALDISQTAPEKVLYIEDRPMFVQVAEGLGIRGLHHVDYPTTVEKLLAFGFEVEEAIRV